MLSGKSKQASTPSARFEEEAAALGALRIAGIDEAGRGPLAGPVLAAAVVLGDYDRIVGLNDSKQLSPAVREKLFSEICDKASATGIGLVDVDIINEINILQATRLAMLRAVAQIAPQPDYLLIDGPIRLDSPIPQRPIIGGDRLSFSVAAAGIVAKVTRDRIMVRLHEQFPEYGFDRHKGYGTQFHRDAVKQYGPCPEHRIHFKGVKEYLL